VRVTRQPIDKYSLHSGIKNPIKLATDIHSFNMFTQCIYIYIIIIQLC